MASGTMMSGAVLELPDHSTCRVERRLVVAPDRHGGPTHAIHLHTAYRRTSDLALWKKGIACPTAKWKLRWQTVLRSHRAIPLTQSETRPTHFVMDTPAGQPSDAGTVCNARKRFSSIDRAAEHVGEQIDGSSS